MRLSIGALLLVACVTPIPDHSVDAGSSCTLCVRFTAAKPVGLVPQPLTELSGLAASRVSPDVLYAHNDSGDTARFFALSTLDAHLIATYTLDGGSNVDWEDIAVGPCPSGSCVYLGDIGDNERSREGYAVYRVPEPNDLVDAEVPFERFAFEYPGGAKHNAESLAVHPLTGRVYVITKESLGVRSEVYRFPQPLDAGSIAMLMKVSDLSVPVGLDSQVTAADIDPCGKALLVRMYNRLVELRLPEGATDFEQIFTQPPVQVPFADEPQGEGVAFAPDGRSYFTSGEHLQTELPLYRVVCP